MRRAYNINEGRGNGGRPLASIRDGATQPQRGPRVVGEAWWVRTELAQTGIGLHRAHRQGTREHSEDVRGSEDEG